MTGVNRKLQLKSNIVNSNTYSGFYYQNIIGRLKFELKSGIFAHSEQGNFYLEKLRNEIYSNLILNWLTPKTRR